MNDNHCKLCTLLPTLDPIFETDYWKVILNLDQGYLGRCFVTLKEHKEDISELTNEEWLDFGATVKRIESAIKQAFSAEMFNWTCLMNNAYQTKPATPHIHWHLRPRYSTSVEFSDLEFTDPEFGHHYDREQRFYAEDDVLTQIKEEIKSKIVQLPTPTSSADVLDMALPKSSSNE